MKDEDIPKDFEDLVKDVHWLNEADTKALMMRLKVVEAMWDTLQKKLEKQKPDTPPEEMLSLLVLSGIVAAKLAPAINLTSDQLSHLIKEEGWDIPDLVKYLEIKLKL